VQKRHEKAGLYNLNDGDDEELTHLGRSLAEIDEFTERDLRLTDDEDEAGVCNVAPRHTAPSG
jgi:hypothetical protein